MRLSTTNYREAFMRTSHLFSLLAVIAGILLCSGCGSSDATSKDHAAEAPAGSGQKPPEQSKAESATKDQTPPVDKKASGQTSYDPHASVPTATTALPTGKFSVQIGAYKQQDNADRVAALAKERFGLNMYTIPDAASGLVKVYVGEFATKDEARKFRDDMAQKYPIDYKDAWVSENPSK